MNKSYRSTRKSDYEDMRNESVYFDKQVGSTKSLKSGISVVKGQKIKDFKNYFQDMRSLLLY